MRTHGCNLIGPTPRIVALIALLAVAGCGAVSGGLPGPQIIDPGRTATIGDGGGESDSQGSDDGSADNDLLLDGGGDDVQIPTGSGDETTGTGDPADSEAPDILEPTTFLHVVNYWGLPQEIYVDDEFIVLVMPGTTSDDFPVEPGFHTLCAYLIGKIDGVCDPLVLEADEVNSWLLFGERG